MNPSLDIVYVLLTEFVYTKRNLISLGWRQSRGGGVQPTTWLD